MPLPRYAESVAKAIATQRDAPQHVADRIRVAQEHGWSIYALARAIGESEQSLRARVKRAEADE